VANLGQFAPFWAILGHFGPFWAILELFGPFGAFRAILGNLGHLGYFFEGPGIFLIDNKPPKRNIWATFLFSKFFLIS
jgi:hypothetical protein